MTAFWDRVATTHKGSSTPTKRTPTFQNSGRFHQEVILK